MSLKRVPITLILFDAFDTLVTPRIAPHLQYAEEARKVGVEISDEKMKEGFKTAFKEMTSKHPIYGLHTDFNSPDQWWTELIKLCLKSAGISNDVVAKVMPTLGPSLLTRFSTSEAYTLAQGVSETFKSLIQLRSQREGNLSWNLATNSDSRILSVCQSLGLDQYLDVELQGNRGHSNFKPPTTTTTTTDDVHDNSRSTSSSQPSLSYFLEYEKPHSNFFHKAVQRAFSLSDGPSDEDVLRSSSSSSSSISTTPSLADLCARTLYVGDDFREDYLGAQRAGLQAVWLKRAQPWPSNLSQEQRKAVSVLDSMEDLPNLLRESWQ